MVYQYCMHCLVQTVPSHLAESWLYDKRVAEACKISWADASAQKICCVHSSHMVRKNTAFLVSILLKEPDRTQSTQRGHGQGLWIEILRDQLAFYHFLPDLKLQLQIRQDPAGSCLISLNHGSPLNELNQDHVPACAVLLVSLNNSADLLHNWPHTSQFKKQSHESALSHRFSQSFLSSH